MKHIRKQREPRDFANWKKQTGNEPAPTYDVLSGPPKTALHNALLQEQGYICCYCTCRISHDDSHIEHFRPQTHYPALALDLSNLHASCQRMIEKKDPPPPLHCGRAKGSDPAPGTPDEQLLLSPLEPGCESFFRYTLAGEMLPSDAPGKHDRAQRTIAILKLGEPRLRAQRERAFAAVLDLISEGEFDEIETEIGRYQARNVSRQFEPFCAGIVYLMKWWRGN